MLRLSHRLALSISLVALICLGWLGGVLLVQTRAQQLSDAREEVEQRLQSLTSLLNSQDVSLSTLQRLALYDGLRIRLYDRQGRELLDTEQPVLAPPDPQPVLGSELSEALQGHTSIAFRDLPATNRLPGEPETIPTLVAAGPVPQGAIHISRRLLDLELAHLDLELRLLYAAVGSLLFSAVLSFVVTRWFSDPINRLSKATLKLAAGQFEPLPTSNDELGALAASFNLMADRIQYRDRVLQQFVTDASHELRTPLASIKTLTEALENGALGEPEQARRFVQLIHSEIERLESLVAQLTNLENPVFQERRFDLEPVVREVCEQMRPLMPLQVETESFEVDGDPDRLRQVLLNLLENARRAVHGRSFQRVWVRLEPGRLTVEDNGVGIPPGEDERIFERFYRVDPVRSRDEGGSGLGLAICKRLVTAHGGTIRAESQPGRTRFVVELPQSE